MIQQSMSGDDFKSDTQRKREARNKAKRVQAGLATAKKLDAAIASLHEYINACTDCDDASRLRGCDDSRLILISNMGEYSSWLKSVYDKN